MPIDDHYEEIVSAQLTQADNAKLISTFFSAAVGAIVVPLLPADAGGAAVLLGKVLVATSLLLTVGVFVLDKIRTVDYLELERRSRNQDWAPAVAARELSRARYKTIRWNDRVARRMKRAAAAQLATAIVSCALALFWLA